MQPAVTTIDFPREVQRTWERTEAIFSWLAPEAYHARPIPLRHPFVFYHGHLPAFAWIKLFGEVLGEAPADPDLDRLFERGIDPETAIDAARSTVSAWPDRECIEEYIARIWRQFLVAARSPGRLEPGHLLLALEHDWMHHETLMYMVHELAAALKRFPAGTPVGSDSPAPEPRMVRIPTGTARLGATPAEQLFGWDNEYAAHDVVVPGFEIDVFNVTNGQYLDYMRCGAAPGVPHTWVPAEDGSWRLRTPVGERPLPLSWPVQVTHREAAAYASWVGKALATEAEWTRAAYGDDPGRPFPWGYQPPGPQHGNFDWRLFTWTAVGSCPRGASPLGVHDLVGNGWEWTSTPFAPFEGFEPMALYPPYSADFFDGKHFVCKGASNFTDARLLRRPFRNWYFDHYPYMHATFRCVRR